MRVVLIIIGLFYLGGCATKLRAPLNHMVTPETTNGMEFELSSQQQAEGKVNVSESEPYPLKFSTQAAMGYYAAFGLLESLDLIWKHTASAPSLVGFKWQFMGSSLQQGGAGNSMAVTVAMGGNEHEIDGGTKVEFSTAAKDFSVIHGYWFTPFWQVFETLGYSSYSFDGELNGGTSGDFSEKGKLLSAAVGTALVLRPYKIKAEVAYTQADWSEAGAETYLSYAFSLGFFF